MQPQAARPDEVEELGVVLGAELGVVPHVGVGVVVGLGARQPAHVPGQQLRDAACPARCPGKSCCAPRPRGGRRSSASNPASCGAAPTITAASTMARGACRRHGAGRNAHAEPRQHPPVRREDPDDDARVDERVRARMRLEPFVQIAAARHDEAHLFRRQRLEVRGSARRRGPTRARRCGLSSGSQHAAYLPRRAGDVKPAAAAFVRDRRSPGAWMKSAILSAALPHPEASLSQDVVKNGRKRLM